MSQPAGGARSKENSRPTRIPGRGQIREAKWGQIRLTKPHRMLTEIFSLARYAPRR